MIRVLDEVLDIGGRGVALFLDTEAEPPAAGSRITDARGQVHFIRQVLEQDGVWMLLVEGGDLAYFERLFRDVRVDATAFALEED